jgi:hypothetical protein
VLLDLLNCGVLTSGYRILLMTEQFAFPDFGCSLGANRVETVEAVDPVDKFLGFPETGWIQ